MKVELNDKGQLVIDVVDLVQKDTAVLRSVAQHALFDDLLLHALAEIFVKGEVQWSEEEAPWWIGSSTFGPNFERARLKLSELAPEGTRVLMHEITRQRDIAVKQAETYQYRAWDAERIVKYHGDKIPRAVMSDTDLEIIAKINAQPAHAEIDWSQIIDRKP